MAREKSIMDLTARDAMSQNYETIQLGCTLDEAISTIRKSGEWYAVVMKGKQYEGVFGYKDVTRLIRKKSLSSKVGQMEISRPPRITGETPLVDVARIIYETNIHGIPVFEGDKVVGIVTPMGLVETALSTREVGKLKAMDVMSPNPVTLSTGDTVGKAISLIKEEGVSTLPVVDDEGRVAGIVETRDILSLAFSREAPSSFADILDGLKPVEKTEIRGVMHTSPLVVPPDQELGGIRERIIEQAKRGHRGVLVATESRLVGVFTIKDIVEKIGALEKREEGLVVALSGLESIPAGDIDIEDVHRTVETIGKKLLSIARVHDLSLHFKSLRDEGSKRLYQVRARATTHLGRFSTTASAWSLPEATSKALSTLLKIVSKTKKQAIDEKRRKERSRKA